MLMFIVYVHFNLVLLLCGFLVFFIIFFILFYVLSTVFMISYLVHLSEKNFKQIQRNLTVYHTVFLHQLSIHRV